MVLGKGSLKDAIRASVSIPGIFAPVILDGRMLVDGGMSDNLPIEVVRKMGADIVIAVDISSPLMNREQLDSVVKVTRQLTNFLTHKNTQQQIATLGPKDILISPDLGHSGATDFMGAFSLIDAGYKAVMDRASDFAALSLPPAEQKPAGPDARQMAQKKYIVQFIDIHNGSALNDDIIRSRLGVELGQPLDFDRLEKNINNIYSLDVFQTVTYNPVRNQKGETGIEINAIPRLWGPKGVGSH